jgi:flagellar biosynthesis GTPase FlhF
VSEQPTPKTFRGKSLAEILPRVKAELGESAIAVNVRQATTGGVAGFFAQRCVEVDAIPGPSVNAVAGDDDEFERLLAAAKEAPAAETFVPADGVGGYGEWDELIAEARRAADDSPAIADIVEPTPQARESASALAAMFSPDAPRPAAPAPAPEPPAAVVASDPHTGPTTTTDVMRAPMVAVEPAWPEMALDIHRTLSARGMDADLVTEVVSEAVEHMLPFSSEGSLRPLVAGQLARCLPPMPRRRPGRLVVGFVGAGGSGKTRCSARLALAYARRGGRPVACLTLRPKDRGAELLADVSHAGIPVHAAEDAVSARRFLDQVGDSALIVVDTPGVSPRAEAELRQLAAELRQLQLDECHLALPATLSPQAAAELVHGTRSLGVDALALTHVDETEHLGAAIGAAIDAQLPISYVGRGAGADRGGLRPALPEALALELVG